MFRIAGSAVLVAVALSAGMAAPASARPIAPRCKVHFLEGSASAATTVDPTGRYVVGSDYNTGEPYLWDSGKHVPITAPSDAESFSFGAVNSLGVVVGHVRRADGSTYPFKYSLGTFVELTGMDVVPIDINSHGDILGVSADQRSFIWPADAPGTLRELEAPPGVQYGALASDLGEDGTVVGNLDDGAHPYVWRPDGTGYIPAEAKHPGGKIRDVSGEWAAGFVATGEANPTLQPARWNLRTNTLTVYEGLGGTAEGVSNTGELVIQPVDQDGRSVLVSRRTVTPLPGGSFSYANDMDANGWTVVGIVDYRAVIWHC